MQKSFLVYLDPVYPVDFALNLAIFMFFAIPLQVNIYFPVMRKVELELWWCSSGRLSILMNRCHPFPNNLKYDAHCKGSSHELDIFSRFL